jgi:hypothetical protein
MTLQGGSRVFQYLCIRFADALRVCIRLGVHGHREAVGDLTPQPSSPWRAEGSLNEMSTEEVGWAEGTGTACKPSKLKDFQAFSPPRWVVVDGSGEGPFLPWTSRSDSPRPARERGVGRVRSPTASTTVVDFSLPSSQRQDTQGTP